jgi:CheY-like chemotaxis protein
MTTETARPSDKRILVVDDEPDVLRYQAAVLEDAGFEVITAADGNEALERVKEAPPDLVSLDLVMPGKSGIRFIHALRRNRAWATIPVIIVTGHAHDDIGKPDLESIREGGLISGPQICLDKPVRPEVYVAAVMERLGIAPSGTVPAAPVREEIDALLDAAGPETLRDVLELLKGWAAGGPSAASGPEGGKTVLVIDDESDVAAYIAAMLVDEGYRAVTETDPREAVERAEALAPDLITLDVDMPERSGIAVYRDLKAVDTLRDVPVLVITGVDQDMRPAFTGQPDLPDIDGYLTKPIEPVRLAETVARILASRGPEGSES